MFEIFLNQPVMNRWQLASLGRLFEAVLNFAGEHENA